MDRCHGPDAAVEWNEIGSAQTRTGNQGIMSALL